MLYFVLKSIDLCILLGASIGLVFDGTSEPRGCIFPLHLWGEPAHIELLSTTITDKLGSSATDAAKLTPPSVCPPAAAGLSTVPSPAADSTVPDADSHTDPVPSADATPRPAVPHNAPKPTSSSFPITHIAGTYGCASAAWQWQYCTHR